MTRSLVLLCLVVACTPPPVAIECQQDGDCLEGVCALGVCQVEVPPPVDAGPPPANDAGGPPPEDAGPGPDDAGAPDLDAGPPRGDAGLVPIDAFDDPWWDLRWQERVRVRYINQERNTSRLVVRVELDAERVDFGRIQADGRDLRFISSALDELAFEADSFDGTTARYWVQLPPLTPRSALEYFWIYYDNPDAPLPQPASPWGDYELVVHFNGGAPVNAAGGAAVTLGPVTHLAGEFGDAIEPSDPNQAALTSTLSLGNTGTIFTSLMESAPGQRLILVPSVAGVGFEIFDRAVSGFAQAAGVPGQAVTCGSIANSRFSTAGLAWSADASSMKCFEQGTFGEGGRVISVVGQNLEVGLGLGIIIDELRVASQSFTRPRFDLESRAFRDALLIYEEAPFIPPAEPAAIAPREVLAEYAWEFDAIVGAGFPNTGSSNFAADLIPTVDGAVVQGPGFIELRDGGYLRADNVGQELKGCAVGGFTAEVWAAPDNFRQTGPARLLTISDGIGLRNFTLGQSNNDAQARGDHWEVRVRSDGTEQNGSNQRASSPNGSVTVDKQQIVVTVDAAGLVRLYIDGEESAQANLGQFEADGWDEALPLLIGDETSENRLWFGAIYRAAFYCAPLSQPQILALFNGGSGAD